MIAWNVDRIFERLGGVKGVEAHCALFASDGLAPAYGTVAVWKHRRRIAAEWLPVVVYGLFALDQQLNPALLFEGAVSDEPISISMEDVGL